MNLFAIFGLTFLAGIHGNAILSNEDTMNSVVLDVRSDMNDNVEKLKKEGPKLLSNLDDKTNVKFTEPGLEIEAKLNNVIWDFGQLDSNVEGQTLNNNTFMITITGTSKQGTFVGDLTITGKIEGREVNEERKFKLSYGTYWLKINIQAPDGFMVKKTGPECKGEDMKEEIIGEEIEGLPKDKLAKEVANELRAQLGEIVKQGLQNMMYLQH